MSIWIWIGAFRDKSALQQELEVCNGVWIANVDAVHSALWLQAIGATWVVTCGGNSQTFDGQTMYDYVHPVLRRLGITHTQFVPSFSSPP